MSRADEKRFHLWWTWNYEQEEKWLNELSRDGLNLTTVKMLGTRYTFTRDVPQRYVYRLDYQPSLRKPHQLREYKDFYQEAGWEYIASTNAWYYFRKPWVAGEAQALYTDRESLKLHYRRIQRIVGVVLLLNVLLCLINMTNLLSWYHRSHVVGIVLPVAVIYAAILFLLGYGYMRLNQRVKEIDTRKNL